MADGDTDCDVPPLEDMSELLAQVQEIKKGKVHPQQKARELKTADKSAEKEQHEIKPARENDSENKPTQPESKSKSNFAGMKKGFLLGPSSKKLTRTSPDKKEKVAMETLKDDIPFIKPQEPGPQESKLKMPEVQEAMKASEAFAKNTEWVTEDLLTKVQKNPVLMKRFSDPRFMQALTEFQTNPQQAMLKYQSNQEVQAFLKEFCSLMGDHFTKLADSQPVTNPGVQTGISKGPVIQEHRHSVSSEDDRRMREILSDPQTREILMDPRIQKLIELLKNQPDKAQSIIRSSDSEMREKLKRLIDVGLLQIQR